MIVSSHSDILQLGSITNRLVTQIHGFIIGYTILFVAEFANLVLIKAHKFNPDAKYQRVDLIRINSNVTNLVTTLDSLM